MIPASTPARASSREIKATADNGLRAVPDRHRLFPHRALGLGRNRKAPPQRGSCHQILYALNEDPQPQVLFTFGFSNLKPAASSVST
jgi:hypothetical protein